jgi:hypothetical protein
MRTTVIRRMSARERQVWQYAIQTARLPHLTVDEADDRMAARANLYESASIRAEGRGDHADAYDLNLCAELLDVARSALL